MSSIFSLEMELTGSSEMGPHIAEDSVVPVVKL